VNSADRILNLVRHCDFCRHEVLLGRAVVSDKGLFCGVPCRRSHEVFTRMAVVLDRLEANFRRDKPSGGTPLPRVYGRGWV